MIETKGKSQKFKGSNPSISPTITDAGIFFLCSGGTPVRGALARLAGKTLRDNGLLNGAAITIYQLGEKAVVQRNTGLQIYELSELNPSELDFVYDSFENLVYDNFGIPVTA